MEYHGIGEPRYGRSACISNYLYENLLCTSYICTKLKDLVKIYADEIDIAPSEKNSIHCNIKGPAPTKGNSF